MSSAGQRGNLEKKSILMTSPYFFMGKLFYRKRKISVWGIVGKLHTVCHDREKLFCVSDRYFIHLKLDLLLLRFHIRVRLPQLSGTLQYCTSGSFKNITYHIWISYSSWAQRKLSLLSPLNILLSINGLLLS